MKQFGFFCATLALAVASVSCGAPRKPIVVGSKNSTEQNLLGEIVALHLEHRLGGRIERRLGIGGTLATYQSLQSGEISVYPEYTGAIESEILREQASPDPAQVLERSRGEMRRVAQAELLDPLGFNSSFVAVIAGDDARTAKIQTLGEAASFADGWKIGTTLDFEQRADGLQALNNYRLPTSAPLRILALPALFQSLEKGDLSMIAISATEGALAAHPSWKVLGDDKKVFTSYQACLLVRQDALAGEPRLKAALLELSGKFNDDLVRKLNAKVDVEHRSPAVIAAEFLEQVGLK